MEHMKEVAELLESVGTFLAGLAAFVAVVKPTKKKLKRQPNRLKK